LEDVAEIPAVLENTARPFWSVMIPTYNCSGFLEHTIRSVLQQDPGADQMQIAVVDDCSSNGKAERIVKRLAPLRIAFLRQPSNVGLAANWNTCIERSQGHWVHILHQDDLVLPGFYDRLGQAVRSRPDVGAAFCRIFFVDSRGNKLCRSPQERGTAGVLDEWFDRLAVGQKVFFPSIVVKRDVYEQLGGFLKELCFTLDWEMWARIAARYPFWYEPEPLACYRMHTGNETTRLQRIGADLLDCEKAIEIISQNVSVESRDRIRSEARRYSPGPLLNGSERHLQFGWMALMSGFVKTARKHACARLVRAPLSVASWRLVYCTIRGH
jgi:glycosyltransferase involved in cell wall biosynthesis